MRVIMLENSDDFNLIYQGFIIGGNSQTTKTMQSIRREAKILDKLDTISDPITPETRYPTGDVARELTKPTELRLTTEEHELLKLYFEAVPWVTKVSRDVVRLADLIDNATEIPDLRAV